jgi:hypothetical protein
MDLFTNSSLSSDGTTPPTGSPGGDETDLLTWPGVPRDSAWLTHVLMSTTTVWVIDWVHSDTSDDWPSLPLSAVLVGNIASLKEWLLEPTTTSDNTDASPAGVSEDNLPAGWELNPSVAIVCVGDDSAGIARAPAITATITWVMLNIANFGTFWDLADWHDVTDVEGGSWAAGDNLTGVDTFWGDNEGTLEASGLGLLENKLGKWGATAWVVDDVLDDAGDLSRTFSGVNWAELGSALTVVSVSLENISVTLTLSSNDVTHSKGRPRR